MDTRFQNLRLLGLESLKDHFMVIKTHIRSKSLILSDSGKVIDIFLKTYFILFYFTCMDVLPACLHACMHTTCVPVESPGTGVVDGCEQMVLVLRVEPGSSARATNALDY